MANEGTLQFTSPQLTHIRIQTSASASYHVNHREPCGVDRTVRPVISGPLVTTAALLVAILWIFKALLQGSGFKTSLAGQFSTELAS